MNILDENDNNVTVISHDNGRNWDKLNLPKNNNENSPYCDVSILCVFDAEKYISGYENCLL